RRRARRRAWWSFIEPARTRCPGGPATFCTSSGGAINASSRRGSPAGWTRAIPSTGEIPRRRRGTEHAMRTVDELAKASEQALALVARQKDVREAEVFVSANSAVLTRLNYTSHIPCNGVEEPKSTEMHGLGIQAVFDSPDGARIGFGSEPSDLSVEGARRALDKARRAAVHDPEFRSLPHPTGEPRTLADYHDPALLAIGDEGLVEAGWQVVTGGLRTFMASSPLAALAGCEAELKR